MNIEKPTVDCDTCNQSGVDENNKFLCKWNPEHKLEAVISESGDKIIRCFYVMEGNAIYENAIRIR
jgi:hypothetical protein